MSSPSQIDVLLRLVPDHPDRVLTSLSSNAQLASASDGHGYSLLHAAASYGHLELLRTLVTQYKADVNIPDEDGETPLFYAERADVVACLVADLGADVAVRNSDGMDAVGKWADDVDGEVQGTWIEQATELVRSGSSSSFDRQTGLAVATRPNGETLQEPQQILRQEPPAMVPENVQISFGTMQELPGDGAAGVADPEIRRKIEELAQRADIDSEETQAELRALVTQVVTGMTDDVIGGGARDAQRRRIDD